MKSAPMPTIARPATCEPEEQVVELEKPGNGALFLWPPCVRVRRCRGCCTSKMLTCSPIATSLYNVTSYNHNHKNRHPVLPKHPDKPERPAATKA
ncbi:hypothetical protein AVEN_19755-1 [Araneus ventricosus]|uniref:Platelet-derived growth factor (PDGF) family profile domain-containing protein n=1 Tax=Araneus ventricosus TaxID=182803 RepID=A0A4Y2VQ38_ARAVE|nr:hypothetical protein AVEN_19755-1 [Araneus ventricosus]